MSSIPVPLKLYNNERWGALDGWGNRSIEVVAERFERKDENYSFIRGHRVRLYKLYDAMHFKVPVTLNISNVQPAQAPPATQPIVRRHDKRGR